jgi:hypothetical protein
MGNIFDIESKSTKTKKKATSSSAKSKKGTRPSKIDLRDRISEDEVDSFLKKEGWVGSLQEFPQSGNNRRFSFERLSGKKFQSKMPIKGLTLELILKRSALKDGSIQFSWGVSHEAYPDTPITFLALFSSAKARNGNDKAAFEGSYKNIMGQLDTFFNFLKILCIPGESLTDKDITSLQKMVKTTAAKRVEMGQKVISFDPEEVDASKLGELRSEFSWREWGAFSLYASLYIQLFSENKDERAKISARNVRCIDSNPKHSGEVLVENKVVGGNISSNLASALVLMTIASSELSRYLIEFSFNHSEELSTPVKKKTESIL